MNKFASTPDVRGPVQDRVEPRPVAWATRHQSNGYITRWSRWHLCTRLADGEKTLCGETIPHTKIETDRRTGFVRGGDCSECQRLNSPLVP